MRRLVRQLAVTAALFFAWVPAGGVRAADPEPDIPLHHHVWGHFAPGAWVRTRAVTVDRSGDEPTETITERLTKLKMADEASYTLVIETRKTVAGRTLEPTALERPPTGYYGENPHLEPIVTAIGDEDVRIGDETAHCRIKRVQIDDVERGVRTVAEIWYAADTSPHILRQEVVTHKLATDGTVVGEPISRRDVRVLSLGAKYTGPDGIERQGAYVSQVFEYPAGKLIIFQLTSDAVPGGVIWQVTRDHDSDQHLRSETRLTIEDYGLEPAANTAVLGEPAGASTGVDEVEAADGSGDPATGENDTTSLLRRRELRDLGRPSSAFAPRRSSLRTVSGAVTRMLQPRSPSEPGLR
ncbi:MAG: hypothetical protein KDA63_17725 [Planctomycetales bacterium]|nr:hypothetical protein [Planctomycetales bacterium]